MNYWSAQLLSALGGQVLAARNSNEDGGWMQVIVFVVVAIFYAVGSIVKARANKTAPRVKEQTRHKPAHKQPDGTIEIQLLKHLWRPERPTPGSQRRPQVVRPQVQPSGRKVARPATARSAVTSPQPAGMAMLEPQMVKPQIQPKVEVAAAAETPRTEYLAGILSDYDDPEKLRRAILHYEILGKPLSLRDPSSEHIIGF
ncbi:MAG: hypothetical protein WAK60_00530 [Sedimentisphaerales bacterium]